jgi:hypothetical protein
MRSPQRWRLNAQQTKRHSHTSPMPMPTLTLSIKLIRITMTTTTITITTMTQQPSTTRRWPKRYAASNTFLQRS